MNRECKAELLGEEDRELVARVSGRARTLGDSVVGELLAARDELCAAAGEVE